MKKKKEEEEQAEDVILEFMTICGFGAKSPSLPMAKSTFQEGSKPKAGIIPHITICPSLLQKEQQMLQLCSKNHSGNREDGRFFIAKSHHSGRMEFISCKCSFCRYGS